MYQRELGSVSSRRKRIQRLAERLSGLLENAHHIRCNKDASVDIKDLIWILGVGNAEDIQYASIVAGYDVIGTSIHGIELVCNVEDAQFKFDDQIIDDVNTLVDTNVLKSDVMECTTTKEIIAAIMKLRKERGIIGVAPQRHIQKALRYLGFDVSFKPVNVCISCNKQPRMCTCTQKNTRRTKTYMVKKYTMY